MIDDGEVPTEADSADIIIRPEKKWSLGDNTLRRNLLIGLEEAKGDIIVFFEDDDYYAPEYLDSVVTHMLIQSVSVVGFSNSRYYNLRQRRFRNLRNTTFSPLSQTAFRKSVKQPFQSLLMHRDDRIDVHFWKSLTVPRDLIFSHNKALTVGMKGMPGRPGLGIGHNCESGEWTVDPDLLILARWIGDDVSAYASLHS